MEQLPPLGDARGLLTPRGIRSEPDVFPQQGETERCCAQRAEILAGSRRNWVILSSRGVFWGGCTADSIPRWQGALQDGLSLLVV